MLFNSVEFLVFFPIVVAIYFVLTKRYRWAFLLLASYYFYASWKVEYLGLILASTAVDYYASLKMSEFDKRDDRKKYLYLSLAVNLGILFFFKYLTLFSNTTELFFDFIGVSANLPTVNLLLPVGISFYTFQTMSYSIDVFRGDREPERHLGQFALFVSFFPQLVAGPIERSANLLPQFESLKRRPAFDYDRITDGLRLMAWGMFKKIVIADRLAIYVNDVYNNRFAYKGLPILIATFFFAFQIYCDFSGYSDIAIGAAKVLGIDLSKNFDKPYFSKSIAEFWSRWHITLSNWFRDYLYIPLGGNRVSTARWYFNIMVVFFVSGLWHGANWTFAVWGIIHGGAYLAMSFIDRRLNLQFQQPLLEYLYTIGRVAITFSIVCLAWIFFRAPTILDAYILLRRIGFGGSAIVDAMNIYEFKLSLILIAFLVSVELLTEFIPVDAALKKMPTPIRLTLYAVGVSAIILLGTFAQPTEFIYFQF